MQYTEGLLFDERYQFERFLGSGSFGEVWLAKDIATDLQVAVKIYISVDQQGLDDFKKEFQLSFNLNHTNLLHANYLGVGKDDNKPYLVMPFCPDGSVSKLAGNMTEQDIWRFIRDVASGLDYLHSQRPPIIHQDIKPDNILMLKSGDFVISDFGISKQLKNTLRKSANLNSTSGAVAYMGPERFSKQYQAVKASDIWSLGVTIYELVYGDLPFCGLGGSLQKQGAEIPDMPEEYSPEIKVLFTSCLAKETWHRPSAKQIADYASEFLAGKTPTITWNYAPEEEATEEVSAPEKDDKKSDKKTSKSSSIKSTVKLTNRVTGADSKEEMNATAAIKSEETDSKDISWWWFVVMAIAGFAVGTLVKFLI